MIGVGITGFVTSLSFIIEEIITVIPLILKGEHAKNQLNTNEIKTPNMNALAEQGIILNRHYTPRMCGPSRNTFFTGRNPIHNSACNGWFFSFIYSNYTSCIKNYSYMCMMGYFLH
jgi:hypothetical protein